MTRVHGQLTVRHLVCAELDSCFFVGDAAGREGDIGDNSDSDK